jgi:hypothetical protein
MDEQQLSALINAAVREAVERTTAELTTKYEADMAGLKKNRDELLAAKKDAEGKTATPPAPEDFDKWLAGLDARIAKLKNDPILTGNSSQPAVSAVREHTITRELARSGQAYREAKEAAEKAGVPLRILDEHAPTPQRRGSPVALIHDEVAGVLHANVRLVEKHGQQRMRALAAEKGATLRAFRDPSELPDEIAARHADIIAKGDRSNLLGDQ